MGGKNHEPCGKYLRNSTRLSRSLSVAYVELELGNVALEDLILAELYGGCGTITEILPHLNQSRNALVDTRAVCADLQRQMDASGFVDLATLQQLVARPAPIASMSTELWYAWSNHGSLCDRETRTLAA